MDPQARTDDPDLAEDRTSDPGVPSGRGTLEELVQRSGPSSGPANLRDLLQRSFRSVVVGGLAGVLVLSLVITGLAGLFIAAKTRQTVVAQAKRGLVELTAREAEIRNDPFERIADYARVLQRDQEDVLAHPELHPPPHGPITLKIAEGGGAYKVEKNGGASVFMPRFSPPTPERARFVELTEAFDPLMQAFLATMPEALVAVYFNGADSVNRYVPFIDEVWKQLDAGVDFDRRVQRNIARCAFFVPVISAVTEKRAEAYFRREWNYALDRSLNMADDAIFILPVAIDAIDARTARIPERFRSLQITAAPGGEAPDEFLQHLKALAAER